MTADEEDNYHVAQANEQLDKEGHFVRKNVSGRYREETQEYERRMFDYMDVSPKMVFSVATALIPFLQNDDEPCADGIQHAASGSTASVHRGSCSRNWYGRKSSR